jgi:hypothetical protein
MYVRYVRYVRKAIMTLSATALRSKLYKVLDEILETGIPVVIERKGKKLKIVPADPLPTPRKLKAHPDYILTDPDELVHIDWSDTWTP